MSELSKQALKVENNQEFPNNNSGFITPSRLRGFNVDMIDSTVNQTQYNVDSGSWNQQIDALEQFTASAAGLSTGSLLVTASAAQNVITFTKGNGSTFNVTIADTTNLTPLNQFTQSAEISITNINAFTQSANTTLVNLSASQSVDSAKFGTIGTQSGSWDNTELNSYTASNDTKWNTLGALSGSFITESETASFARTNATNTFTQPNIFTSISASGFISASEFVGNGSKLSGITASISMPILDEGVPQGNAVSLNFTGSAIGATVVGGVAIISVQGLDTGSFNAYTQSINAFTQSADQRLDSLEAATSSYAISASVAAVDAAQQSQIDQLTAFTGSVSTVATASLLVTASATLNTITFTKGDNTTFNVTVATGSSVLSASYAEFAETSSITRNVVVIARNGGASTLAAGTVVHITSAVGDNPIFTTASYDTEALSGNTFGLLRNSSPSGADVEVVVSGVVTGVNTDPALGYTAGDIVYLSSSGQFTRVQPQAPNQIVTLGQVLRAQQNNGSIYVSINNGWELNELHNVQINNPQTGDLLQYESASYGLWKNRSIEGAGITTTSSFNAYTSSNDSKVNALIAATASYANSASVAAVDAGQQAQINSLIGITGSFATTASNTFTGDQTFIDAGGNYSTLTDTSGSLMLVARGLTSASLHLSSSTDLTRATGSVNLIFKTNNGTPPTFISGSGNIIYNSAAALAGFRMQVGSNNILNGVSLPQLTGSMAFPLNIGQNVGPQNYVFRGPVSASTWTFLQNVGGGSINIGPNVSELANQYVGTINISSNTLNGTLNVVAKNNLVYGTTLISNNDWKGGGTSRIAMSSSAATIVRNTVAGEGVMIFNDYFSGSVGFGSVGMDSNIIYGGNNIVLFTGSATTSLGPQFSASQLLGTANQAIIGAGRNILAHSSFGNGLIASASSNIGNTDEIGSVFLGRWNANDGVRNRPGDDIFVVGTGTSNTNRKTGFLIDSGSNTFVEGTLNVSGSTSLSGSSIVTGSLIITGSSQQNVLALSISSNTASMDLLAANYFTLTLADTANTHITATNIRPGMSATLVITTGTNSSASLAPTLLEPSGSEYVASNGSGRKDVLSFIAVDSTNLYAVSTKNMI